MKKLMTALFALSAITAFAQAPTQPTAPAASLDSASATIEITATVQAQSQLVLSESSNSGGSSIAEVSISHGTLNKTNLVTTENGNNSSVQSKTLYVRRDGSDKLLFSSNHNKVTVSIRDTSSITLKHSDTAIEDTLLGTLSVTQPQVATNATSASFKVTSSLTPESITKAIAGSYSGQKTIDVVVGYEASSSLR